MVSLQSFTYIGFSGALIIFETKINILLMQQYPFFKDIAHVLIPPFRYHMSLLNSKKILRMHSKTKNFIFWMTADVQHTINNRFGHNSTFQIPEYNIYFLIHYCKDIGTVFKMKRYYSIGAILF